MESLFILFPARGGRKARIRQEAPRPGDQGHTMADISKARNELGYNPCVGLRDGLAAQIEWQRALLET